MPAILVVDDEASSRGFAEVLLRQEGFDVRVAPDGRKALALLEERLPDLVLSDLQMPELDGMGLLDAVRGRWPELPVIVFSVQEEIAVVVEAVRRGARNYLLKPCSAEAILTAVQKSLVPRRPGSASGDGDDRIATRVLGESRAIVRVREQIALAGRTDVNVLITGETGSGKEVVSRAIHSASKLAAGPFVPHNCAATPDALFESTFFGHRKGAFTGADRDHSGLLEDADGGVLFLDELSSMGTEHQAKLLRVMDDGEVRRVGDTRSRRVTVRFLAALNVSPADALRERRLREDLYFRLRGVEIGLPPLRERREDVPLLARHFLGRSPGFTPAALEVLVRQPWPGNVRELANVVRRAEAFADGGTIDEEHLGLAPGAAAAPGGVRTLRELEEKAIREALEAAGGNRSHAARLLGIDRSTLRRKLAGMDGLADGGEGT